jgi:tight adherence protein B
MPDTRTLMYVAAFVAVILLIEGLYLFLIGARRHAGRAANLRARLQAKGLSNEEVLLALRRNRAEATGNGPLARLDRLLSESGATITVWRFLFICIVLTALVAAGLLLAFDWRPIFAISIAVVVGILFPIVYFKLRRRKRFKKFGDQLPDALDMTVRSLKAGHPIKAAMNMVAKEMADPIASEFGIVVDEMTYGLELNEALDNLGRRVSYTDLHYMIVSINIQSASGGNLAEVLSNLASVIRDRIRMYKKVDALSAEGKLSGYVIGVVPIFIALAMTFNKSTYYTEAMGHPAFFVVLVVCIVFYLVSMFAIYKITHIHV